MSIPNKQIGWSNESNLLWLVSKQIERLNTIIANSGGGGGGGVASVTGPTVTGTATNPVVGLATFQQIMDNNHDLVNGRNYQGTLAGSGNTGINVNALGNSAAETNTAGSVNAFGLAAAYGNAGIQVNAFGYLASFNNVGRDVNALGEKAGYTATGAQMNAMGLEAGMSNTATNLNAFGTAAGKGNTATNVNAFGSGAGLNNTFKNVNLFGATAVADAENQNVYAKWVSGVTYYFGRLSFNNITANRKWELPNTSGTIALLTDIPSLTGYVPYTGATTDLNLGAHGAVAESYRAVSNSDGVIVADSYGSPKLSGIYSSQAGQIIGQIDTDFNAVGDIAYTYANGAIVYQETAERLIFTAPSRVLFNTNDVQLDVVDAVYINTIKAATINDVSNLTQVLNKTNAEILALTPVEGETYYNTTIQTFVFYDGATWKRISHSAM